MGTKSARRNMYRETEPVSSTRLSTAIRELEEFFNPQARQWKEPIPVWLGMALVPQMENFKIFLAEYRRARVELLDTRNHRNRLERELFKSYEENYQLRMGTRFRCRRRLAPIAKLIVK